MTRERAGRGRWPAGRLAAALLCCVLGAGVSAVGRSDAATLPSGFADQVVFSGLAQPTAVQFSPDGRIFVAEKSGIIKVFNSLTDPSPAIFADLSTQVYNFWDRGLLGLELDPAFPTAPYVYVLYSRDAVVGGVAPRFGTPGITSDPCPTPPGATADGCVISGRLSRLEASGNVMSGPEKVLIDDWCQQFPSHSVGGLAFGADGALYASGGDGANFNLVDYGQSGQPTNPCGDPPSGVGGVLSPPTAEGGALRSQDLRTSGDPAGLNGTIIRVDPATGDPLPDNPGAFSSDQNVKRIVAYGLRNPFRIAVQPGTDKIFAGDVGSFISEEIDVASHSAVSNFGWPCYEGVGRNDGFDAVDLSICETLYGTPGAVTAPLLAYSTNGTSTDACPSGSSSISGLAFYGTGAYPSRFQNALFFADYSRNCIWAALGADPTKKEVFATGVAHPVDLKTGPGGDLFYVDFDSGTLHRITYSGTGTGSDVFVSDLTAVSSVNGWGPVERDRSNGEQGAADGGPLTLAGVVFAKGLGVHALSDVRYTVPAGCSSFVASVGVDDEVGASGSVVFQVLVDGVVGFDSGVMSGSSATKSVSVPVSAGGVLRLLVDPNGVTSYDHADWADAKFVCGGGGGGNQAPVVTAPVAQSSVVGQSVSLQVVGSDPDAGQVLAWSASGLPAGLSINASSGLIAGTVGSGAAAGSPYTVSVTATDNGSPVLATTKSFTWTVTTGGGGSTVFVSDLTAVSSVNGWGPVERDRSNGELGAADGGPLTLAGVVFAKGLGVHALSDVRYTVPAGCSSFVASVGVDDEVGASGSVVFQVLVDGVVGFDSGVMSGSSATKSVSVPVSAGGVLRLLVDPNGVTSYDHADWADAKFVCGGGGGGNTPPRPTIATPTAGTTWKVGDVVSFSGSAADDEDGPLPNSALSWSLVINHCPSTCHAHVIQTYSGVASGSFTAPDHEYPSTLELRLTATDSNGSIGTTNLVLQPKTVNLTFNSTPTGLSLVVGGAGETTPFTRTVIVGSTNSVSAPASQSLAGQAYAFSSWSDGGTQSHAVVAGATAATYTASYSATSGGSSVFVSDLTAVSSVNGWGPVERDRSNGEQGAADGGPLTLAGVVFAKGLGVHALSDVRYTVPAGCSSFVASVGVDDEVGASGSVVFQVLVDGVVGFDSGVMSGSSATKSVSVPVSAGGVLRLLVDPNGVTSYDHADWADAKFVCGGGGGGNQAPVVTAPVAQSSVVGQSVSLQVVGSDPDAGQVLAWSASGLPAGLSINASSGLIAGTVGSGAAAGSPYTVSVTATDNGSPVLATTKSFTWTVTTGGGGSTVFVSDLTAVSSVNGWGPVERDRSNGEQGAADGGPLTLAGVVFAKGLGVHALSDVRYTVPAGCSSFVASVGVDDEVGASGSVVFQVLVDGVVGFDSGVMSGSSATKSVSVPVSAGGVLRLLVDPNGVTSYDHADWADAKFVCGGGGGGNQAPVVTAPVAQSSVVGQSVSLQVVGSDPDAGQVLAWSASGLPAGLSINASSGLIAGTVGSGAAAGSPYTVSVTATDNGSPVLATTKSFTWTVTTGGGGSITFAAPVSIATGAHSHSVLASDIDGDGDKDLVTAVAGANVVAVSLNNGSGVFGAPVTYATGAGTTPKFADVGDINGDGKLDIATANQDASTTTVLLGNGDGTFAAGVQYAACQNTHEVAIADVNGDGKKDVVAACFGGDKVSVLLNTGNASGPLLAAKVDYQAASGGHSLVLRDFDGDGDLDIAVAALYADTVAVLLNNGTGTFGAPTLNAVPGPHNVRSADLNGDGKLDLVATSQTSDSIRVLLGNGNGTFAAGVSYAVGSVPKASAIGDLNGDGKLDIAVTITSNNYPNGSTPTSFSVLLGDGLGAFSPGTTVSDDLTPFAIVIADFNGDAKNDVATANWHSNDVKVFRRT